MYFLKVERTLASCPLLSIPMKMLVNVDIEYFIVSGTLFDTEYKQHCRAPPPIAPLRGPLADINSDRQQHNIQLYCGYCNIQYETAVDLVEHCKQDLHKDAVFADSGRDVFWEFEPPPTKAHNISAAIYG